MTLGSPEPLSTRHDVAPFFSGSDSLDQWLKGRAAKNQLTGASRTYVASEGKRVVGFYALAAGAVEGGATIGSFRRNMPDPVPVAMLGRLAVDRAWQEKGLGRALVRHACSRVGQAADVIGIRGMVVHALNDGAQKFYQRMGFDPSPRDPMLLMIKLTDLKAGL